MRIVLYESTRFPEKNYRFDKRHQAKSTKCVPPPNLQKVLTTQPLVAEIISDCGRIKTGVLSNFWKLSALIL